jgi:hypothetical protein
MSESLSDNAILLVLNWAGNQSSQIRLSNWGCREVGV